MNSLIPFARSNHPIELKALANAGPKRIEIDFVISRGLSLLRWPRSLEAPSRKDRLWERTCFEAFLLPEGGASYWEINASPSGDWNLYRFDDYRQGMREEPRILDSSGLMSSYFIETAEVGRVRLELDRSLVPEWAGPLRVGLTAVLEFQDSSIEYWALAHVGDDPDFHRSASFVQRLEAGRGE